MKRSFLVIVSCFLVILPAQAWFEDIRKPAAAGQFYPADKYALSAQIDKFMGNLKFRYVKGKLIALIVPHAGYDYSGQVAAYAYKELEGKRFKRVVLLGASHSILFDGVSVGEYDHYETPLGRVPVDREFTKKLIGNRPDITFLREAHEKEHSLEVQLPFLQKMLKNDFKIVPIIFGRASFKNCQLVALSLIEMVDDDTLIVCSTDWSHYHDDATVNKMDRKGIKAVLDGDIASFVEMLNAGSTEACGAAAVITTMLAAPAIGANNVQLLQRGNSGDLPAGRHGVSGDRSRVVGYAAIAYSYGSSPLTEAEKQALLKIARGSIEIKLSGEELPGIKIDKGTLVDRRGVFVTLTKNGELRGCIGYIQPLKPLAEAVQEMAVAAATSDLRFQPVTKDELPAIKVDISVLSRLTKVEKINEIKVGRDGLYIIAEGKSGLLLPQVATDQGWDREQFLQQVCLKAGLPPNTWKKAETVLYRFTAEVFGE